MVYIKPVLLHSLPHIILFNLPAVPLLSFACIPSLLQHTQFFISVAVPQQACGLDMIKAHLTDTAYFVVHTKELFPI